MVNAKIIQLLISAKQVTFFLINHQFLKQESRVIVQIAVQYLYKYVQMFNYIIYNFTWMSLSPFNTSKCRPIGGLPALEHFITKM